MVSGRLVQSCPTLSFFIYNTLIEHIEFQTEGLSSTPYIHFYRKCNLFLLFESQIEVIYIEVKNCDLERIYNTKV